MVYQFILKLIPSLIYTVIFLSIFYWQFIYIYSFLIRSFGNHQLEILYMYIFVYTYGVLILSVTLINIFYKYLINNIAFILFSLVSIIIFYILSFRDIYHIIEFLLRLSTDDDRKLLMVFFIVLSFGYAIYTMFMATLKKSLNLLHIFVITLIGILYPIYIINKL